MELHPLLRRSLTSRQFKDLVFVLKMHLSRVVFASSFAQALVKDDLKEMKSDIEYILSEINKGKK